MYKRSLCLWLGMLMFSPVVFGQAMTYNGEYKDVDYMTASPEASSMIKANSSSVSLATGALNVNIPIYPLSLSGFSLPISLSYSTKGVRVDELSSVAGLGWTLMAGGVVTRTVLDMPDEARLTYAMNNFNAPSLDSIHSMDLYNYLKEDDITDTETDVFQFNVGGLNGSFYLNDSLVPVLMTRDNIRVYRLPGDSLFEFNGFRIVDDKGIEYLFTVVESSRKYTTGGASCKNAFEVDVVTPVPTAWHLSKIRINSYDSILFNYDPVWEEYQTGVSQRVSKVIESDKIYTCSPVGPEAPPPFTQTQIGLETFSQCLSIQESTVQNLTGIICSDGTRVVFTYGFTRMEHGGAGLSRVVVMNSRDEVIKQVDVELETIESINTVGIPGGGEPFSRSTLNKYRTFLKSVVEVDVSDSTKKNAYSLYYNDATALPPRLSFAQDHWGYYNGQNNTNFFADVPEHPYNGMFDGTVGGTDWTGNRNPSSSYMYKGTLDRVVYPTGGYEKFNYGTAVEKVYEPIEQDTTISISRFNDDFTATPVMDTIYVPFGQVLTVNSSCTRDVEDPDFHGSCTYQVFPLDTTRAGGTGYSTTVENPELTKALFLDEGYYVISTYTSAVWDSTLSEMSVTYQHENPVMTEVDHLLGGVVVQSQKRYTGEGALAEEVKYIYSDADDSLAVVKRLASYPDYFSMSEASVFEYCVIHMTGIPSYISCSPSLVHKSVVLNSNIIKPSSLLSSAPYYFSSVKEYRTHTNGDWNGMVRHRFLFADAFPVVLDPFQKHGDMITGAPKGFCPEFLVGENITEVFEGDSSSLNLKQRSEKFYSAEMLTPVVNQVIYNKYENVCTSESFPIFIDGFDVTTYMLQGMHVRLDSTREHLFEPGGELQTFTRNYYDNPEYPYPTRTSTLNSKGDSLHQFFFYPSDLLLSAYNSAGVLTRMLERNFTSALVESIRKNGDVQTEKQAVKYKEFPASSYDFVPDSTFSFAGSETVPSQIIAIPSYGERGNVLEVSKVNDMPVSYFWGYGNRYPVAKVVGRGYTEALSLSGLDTSVLNNLTTTDAAMRAELNKLRSLDSCLVTTFTYKPLLGVTSRTDERGNVAYYEYDGFNRLSLVRDQDSNIVKMICYNYFGEPEDCGMSFFYNVVKSDTFTRNNCGAGYSGGSVIYTVPAGTYSSMVDQATADSLAQADVDANGQAYANTNGTCTPLPVYARLEYQNIFYDFDMTTADLVLKFYSDAACTIPYSVTNLDVNYSGVRTNCGGGSPTTFNYTAYNCSGTSVVVATDEILMEDDGIHCYEWIYSTTSGTGYTPQ